MSKKSVAAVLAMLAFASLAAPVAAGQPPPRDGRGVAGETRSGAIGAGEVSGRVRSRAGQSLDGAVVVLRSQDVASFMLSTVADGRGTYHFDRLPAGRYVVRGWKTGFGRRFHGEDRPGQPPSVIEVEPGRHARGVDVILPKGGVITGRVGDEEGRPLPSANVVVLRQAPGRMAAGMVVAGADVTDDRGVYRVFDLEPGSYYVRAVALPAQLLAGLEGVGAEVRNTTVSAVTGAPDGYTPTYYPGTARVGQARRITVRESQEVAGADFSVLRAPIAAVTGVVVAPPGASPGGAEVTLQPADGAGVLAGGSHSEWADMGGRFSFRGIPQGRYILTAVGSTASGDVAFGRQAVVLSGGRLDGLSVVLAPGTEVTGTVRFEGADPQWRDIVNLQVTTRMLDATQTRGDDQSMLDGDNRFRFHGLPPDLRIFEVAGIGETRVTRVLERISLNGRDITDRPIDLGGRSQVTGLEVVLTDRVSSLVGAVRGSPDGASAVVVAFPMTPELWFPDSRHVRVERPAQSGRYRVEGIPPGDYWVAAAPLSAVGGDDWLSPRFLERLRTRASRATVRKGDTVTVDLQARGR